MEMLAPIRAKKTRLSAGAMLSSFSESKIAWEWKLATRKPANMAVMRKGQWKW